MRNSSKVIIFANRDTVWPLVNEQSGGYNKTGILLAFLAVFEFYHRPEAQKPHPEKSKSTVSNELVLDSKIESDAEAKPAVPTAPPAVDDFPEGGLKAWSVVLGVSTPDRAAITES